MKEKERQIKATEGKQTRISYNELAYKNMQEHKWNINVIEEQQKAQVFKDETAEDILTKTFRMEIFAEFKHKPGIRTAKKIFDTFEMHYGQINLC